MWEDASIYTKATLVFGICSQIHKRYPLTPRERGEKNNKKIQQQQQKINEVLIYILKALWVNKKQQSPNVI